MARNLYRFYLYTVFIALLIFAAVAAGQLLNILLLLTPLRSFYDTVPNQASVTQAVVFALVSWVIVALLGGLHYWLIRRDIRHDPAAGTSAIRSFFLNITEAVGIAIAVPVVGFFVLGQLAQSSQANTTGAAALALPTLALVVALEVERRRIQVSSGAAIVFQRLHFYGVQLLFLIFLWLSWQNAISPLVDKLLFAGRVTHEYCGVKYFSSCLTYNYFYLIASVLWFVLFWIGYGWLTRNDKSTLLRFIVHFSSLAIGVGFLLTGIYRAVVLALLPLLKVQVALRDIVGPAAPNEFISLLTLGILVIVIYHLWLSIAARQGLIERKAMFSTECAVAAILSALVFWAGWAFLLYSTLQHFTATTPDAYTWASNIALVIAGVGYIPLALFLRRLSRVDPSTVSGARRGFVLALLGSSILAFAIGGAVAFYSWATSLFGSPIANWQQVAQSGFSAFVVGIVVGAIYLRVALQEKVFSTSIRRAPSDSVAPVKDIAVNAARFQTLEDILDELLVGKITRDEAATRIRALEKTLTSTSIQKS